MKITITIDGKEAVGSFTEHILRDDSILVFRIKDLGKYGNIDIDTVRDALSGALPYGRKLILMAEDIDLFEIEPEDASVLSLMGVSVAKVAYKK